MTDKPESAGRWQHFRRWRQHRPFWGGSLLVIAGLLTVYLPITYDHLLVIATGSFTGSALLFGALVLLCGLTVLTIPRLSTVFGLLGVLLSVVAIFGALGGFLIGSLLGGLGGVLSFAWRAPTGETDGGERTTEPDTRASQSSVHDEVSPSEESGRS